MVPAKSTEPTAPTENRAAESGPPLSDARLGPTEAPAAEDIVAVLQEAGVDIDDPKGRKLIAVMGTLIEGTSGPFPPPSMLKAYQQIDPRIVDEILDGARKQREHRHKLEELVTRGSEGRMDKAQRNATLLTVLGVAVAVGTGVLAALWDSWILGVLAIIIVVLCVGGPTAATALAKAVGRNLPRQ